MKNSLIDNNKNDQFINQNNISLKSINNNQQFNNNINETKFHIQNNNFSDAQRLDFDFDNIFNHNANLHGNYNNNFSGVNKFPLNNQSGGTNNGTSKFDFF